MFCIKYWIFIADYYFCRTVANDCEIEPAKWQQTDTLLMEFISYYNLIGLVIGLATFLIIGLFHPLVIKGEYYFGTGCWWVFAVAGILFIILSVMVREIISSSVFGVTAFSCFWSILELVAQKKRVEKGWFPANPKRKNRIKH